MPAAVESPITIACTPSRGGPEAGRTGAAASRPTSSSRLPTPRNTPGAVAPVTMIAPMLRTSTNSTPPRMVTTVLFHP
jgi:hypothetical protein